MEKDLRLEVFASTKQVIPIKLHTYNLKVQNIDNPYKIIRGACWKIRNYYKCGAFENGNNIFTTEKIPNNIPSAEFELEYLGESEPDVLENRKVYCEMMKYCIIKKLEQIMIRDNWHKYSCKSDVTSRWIMTEKGFQQFVSENREISLERKYNFWIEIQDDKKAYLKIDTGSVYVSNRTVFDYMTRGIDVIGMEVKNDWAKNKQSGILKEICDITVSDPIGFADSLKQYYITKNEAYRVEKIPDDTPIVMVELRNGTVLPYYPQALKPIMTREKVGQIDSDFSAKIEKYVKRDMKTRLTLDKDFIDDIGQIDEFGYLAFEPECCPIDRIGLKKGLVKLPMLTCGNNKDIECGQEYQAFNFGFYKKPDKKIKIGYLYPCGSYELMKAFVFSLYYFGTAGYFQGKKDPYVCTNLLDIQAKPVIQEEYELGDITDYKRKAHKLKEIENVDIFIVLVPDGMDNDGPYNPFKRIWAEANIPSQMISMSTAKMFAQGGSVGMVTRYYLQNIVLGILGKTGGIPWIVKNMPGNVDCFVGLDVAMLEKGIHYPACSVVFDKFGKLLGVYKPKRVQKGERIETDILQDIFDQVIISYEAVYGETPKNIVIHRDGFSNENNEWYGHYFETKGIEYTLVEVRKNISSKLAMLENGVVKNPDIGYCVYNANKAYLVTTNMRNKKGSPNPLLIEKKCGKISMPCILTQILFLTQIHVGSTQKIRLPITTGYADKICKNLDFIPEGKMGNKLFFL